MELNEQALELISGQPLKAINDIDKRNNEMEVETESLSLHILFDPSSFEATQLLEDSTEKIHLVQDEVHNFFIASYLYFFDKELTSD